MSESLKWLLIALLIGFICLTAYSARGRVPVPVRAWGTAYLSQEDGGIRVVVEQPRVWPIAFDPETLKLDLGVRYPDGREIWGRLEIVYQYGHYVLRWRAK